MSDEVTIPVNVIVSEADKKRILRDERAWSGRRLVLLCAVTLTLALGLLYFLASTTAESGYPTPLFP